MIDPTLQSLQLLIEANDRRLNDLMKERELRDKQRYDASRDALHAALGCAKEAIAKAEAAYEKRFDNTNEWIQTFSELSGKIVTRMEYSSAYDALNDKIDEASGRIKIIEGKSTGIGASIGVVMAVAALLISLMFGAINLTRLTPEMVHPSMLQAPR